MQKYAYSPGSSKVRSPESPWLKLSVSNDLSSAVAVCGALSWFVNVTVVPASTVSASGS